MLKRKVAEMSVNLHARVLHGNLPSDQWVHDFLLEFSSEITEKKGHVLEIDRALCFTEGNTHAFFSMVREVFAKLYITHSYQVSR